MDVLGIADTDRCTNETELEILDLGFGRRWLSSSNISVVWGVAPCNVTCTEVSVDLNVEVLFIYLLAIRKNTVYKLMWWLYKVRYDTMYFNDVVGRSSSDVTSGAFQV